MKLVGADEIFTGNEFMRSLSDDYLDGPNLFLYWLPARCRFFPCELGRKMKELITYGMIENGHGDSYEYVVFDDDELLKAHVYTFNDLFKNHNKNLWEMFKAWDDWASFALKIIDDKTLNRILFEPYECPNCHGHLMKKHGSWGEFYGCSNYPNCKYAISDKSYYNNDKEKYEELLDYDKIREAFFGVCGEDKFDYKRLEQRFSHKAFTK